MKSKLKLPIKTVGAAFLLFGILVTACKKEEIKIDPIAETKKISDDEFSKLLKYLSITTTAPTSEIKYNEKKDEFVIYGWLHMAEVQLQYSTANEYKATYEK